MPISLADKAVAALAVLNPDDIRELPPAERRRLADVCRHVAAIAEPEGERPTEPLPRSHDDLDTWGR